MHPLAHALTGALIGQVAPSPALSLAGGIASHFVLDVVPHAEGDTFREEHLEGIGWEHLEAVVELGIAVAGLWWVGTRCPDVGSLRMALGALGGLLPDIIDLPLHTLFGISLLHRKSWHRTVPRGRAVFGLLTQMLAIMIGGYGLWLTTGCRR